MLSLTMLVSSLIYVVFYQIKGVFFYFNNMTRLIRTLQCPFDGFDCIFLTCFQYGIILCPKIFAGVEFLPYAFSNPTVNRKKKEKERRELLKISDLLCGMSK